MSEEIHSRLRRIDALIHQVIHGKPLWLARGPFYDGVAVPSYSFDEGAAFALFRVEMPEANLRVEIDRGSNSSKVTLSNNDSKHEVEAPGDSIALPISLACLQNHLSNCYGMTWDAAGEQIAIAMNMLAEGGWELASPALPEAREEVLEP